MEDHIIKSFWGSGRFVWSVRPFAVLRLKALMSAVMFAGWGLGDDGEMGKNCVGESAGFGWRKFLGCVS